MSNDITNCYMPGLPEPLDVVETARIIYKTSAIKLIINEKEIIFIPFAMIRTIDYNTEYNNCNIWVKNYNHVFKYTIEHYNELCDKFNEWLNNG